MVDTALVGVAKVSEVEGFASVSVSVVWGSAVGVCVVSVGAAVSDLVVTAPGATTIGLEAEPGPVGSVFGSLQPQTSSPAMYREVVKRW